MATNMLETIESHLSRVVDATRGTDADAQAIVRAALRAELNVTEHTADMLVRASMIRAMSAAGYPVGPEHVVALLDDLAEFAVTAEVATDRLIAAMTPDQILRVTVQASQDAAADRD